jgi:hypothetical protein
MLIVVVLGLVGALAWAGTWVHGVWTSVPRCNADFEWGGR